MKIQSRESISFRALSLWIVCIRANLEADTLDEPHQKDRNQTTLNKYLQWATTSGIAAHYSEEERDVISRPVGSIPFEEVHRLGMRLQALGALLWAISKMEMPPYFDTIAAADIQPLLPERDQPLEPFLHSAQLQSEEVLRRERRRAEFWNWRCRCDQMRRSGTKPPRGQTYKKTIASAVESALKDGLIDEVEAGDVSCDGVPFFEFDDQQFAYAASSALERHYALNWVCGYSANWDQVPTDT